MDNDRTGSIDYALQRLLPDVFLHPVWTHFVEVETLLSQEQRRSLECSADEMLAAGCLEDACRALFICAFQQLRAGDCAVATTNLQRILVLSEQHGLPQIAQWAAWGAVAVCVQRGCSGQAAEYLEHLQFMLSRQHEWVLSNVIDVLRQTLLSTADVTAIEQLLPPDTALSSAFEQLLRWGMPRAANGIIADDSLDGNRYHSDVASLPSSSTGFGRPSIWQTIKRILRGELQLKWVETDGHAPLTRPEERKLLISASHIIVKALPPAASPPQLARAGGDDVSSTLNRHPIAALEQPLLLAQQPEPDRLAPSDQTGLDQPDSATGPVALPSITAHLLGTFSFAVNDATVQSWPTGKGRAVLKYLLAHHDQPMPRDLLMDAFWPQAGPEAARNSLNVALHGLRQALKTVTEMPVILFEEGAYCLNPEFHLWIDVDEFECHIQSGRCLEAKDQRERAVAEYEAAVELYQGDFLAGDLYEEWPVLTRERLRVTYLETLDRLSQIYFARQQYAACITTCQQLLAHDNCREDAHCLLMQCYCRQDQHHLALRQYRTCAEALRTELDVDPAPTTTQLYERIRRREKV